MTSPDKTPTLFEVIMRKVGVRKAASVVEFLGFWSLTMHKHEERWPYLTTGQRVEAYADVAKLSRTQAFRYQARFREVFGKDADPTEVCERLQVVAANRKQAKDVFGIGLRPSS